MGDFHGKVALVTGAGSGIGRATAEMFARAGAKVVVSDLNADTAAATAAHIASLGGSAVAVRADVSHEADVVALVGRALDAYGRLDAAFNNAGVNPGAAEQWEEPLFSKTIAVNLTGVMLCMRVEIDAMLKSGGGAIVNMSSLNGLVANSSKPVPAYTASKHGVIGLTKQAAAQYGRQNIRANAVCPGLILTPMVEKPMAVPAIREAVEAMTPMGRIGRPEEVASAVLWLCSDAASYITGHALAIDGGASAV